MLKNLLTTAVIFLFCISIQAQQTTPTPTENIPPIQVGGAFPNITAVAGHNIRNEARIGAMLPWADKLWFVAYVAHDEFYEAWKNILLFHEYTLGGAQQRFRTRRAFCDRTMEKKTRFRAQSRRQIGWLCDE